MIYKGNVLGRYYKSLGNCVIKDKSNTTLETIPWYVEYKLYKGDSLIYPAFNTKYTYDDVPAHNYDCAIAAFCENTIPTPVTLLDWNSIKYGATYSDPPGVNYGTYSDTFSLQQSLIDKVSIAFNWSVNNLVMEELNKVPQSPEFFAWDNTRTDVVISDYYTHNKSTDTANISFEATFLTNSNVTGITMELYKASSTLVGDEVAKAGSGSAGNWTSFSNVEDAYVIGSGFQYTKLWRVSVGGSCSIPNDGYFTHIAPRVVASYGSHTRECHIQAVNLSYALHLSHS